MSTTARSGGAGSPEPAEPLEGSSALLTPRSGRVKDLRKLHRRSVREERGLFLVEGSKSVREALDVPGCVSEVYATPDARSDGDVSALLADCESRGLVVRPVNEAALAALADTVTPQGVVALCRHVARQVDDAGLRDLVAGARLVAVCAEVRDPGNAGTVIRCADAAGADLVVLAGESVDPHNPKTVRATVGSLFHLPVLQHADAEAVVDVLGSAGLVVLAADGGGSTDLDDAADDGSLARPTAWLLGNEARGLPEGLASRADARVAIPIHGRAESLNLATAAAVCLYASARAQRRTHPDFPAES